MKCSKAGESLQGDLRLLENVCHTPDQAPLASLRGTGHDRKQAAASAVTGKDLCAPATYTAQNYSLVSSAKGPQSFYNESDPRWPLPVSTSLPPQVSLCSA